LSGGDDSVHYAPPGVYHRNAKDPSAFTTQTDSPVADYVSFGPGLRFYSLRYLHRTLAPTGFTVEALAHLCTLYGVPLVYFHPRHAFVEFDTFKLVLRSLVAPGGHGIPASLPDVAPSSHFDRLRDTARLLVSELYALRKLNQLPAPADLKASLDTAASTLALHAMQIRDVATFERAMQARKQAAILFEDEPESITTYFDVDEEAQQCHPNFQDNCPSSPGLAETLWSIPAEQKSQPPSSTPTGSERRASKTASTKRNSSIRSSPTSAPPTPPSLSEPSPSS
jgi:hypothetical protein